MPKCSPVTSQKRQESMYGKNWTRSALQALCLYICGDRMMVVKCSLWGCRKGERSQIAGKMNGGKSLGVMVVMVVVVLGMWEVKTGSAAPSAAECKEERRLAINACKPVVYGKDPSPACCERARVTHIECVCPVITPKLAALIDVNRAVRLIEGCGRKVPRHYKCGSMSTFLSPSLNYIYCIYPHLLRKFKYKNAL